MMRKFLPLLFLLIPIITFCQGPYCTAPATYYNGLAGLNCNALKAALFTKIAAGYKEQVNSAFWEIFEKTDKHRNDANTKDIVWDIYTDKPNAAGDCEFTFVTDQDNGTLGNAECQKFNREHTMPQSWFGSGTPMVTDLFEIYPTDKYVNAQHDNFPYGEVNAGGSGVVNYNNGSRRGPSAIAGITGTVFEPIDEYKGDLARSYLYMATRYHDVVASWDKLDPSGDKALDGKQYPSFEIPYLKMLLKWHHQDPVSQKEINRNNAIYCIQKNRNPYIDKPELVDLVWNPTCAGAEALPVDIILFKGQLSGDQVLLNWDAANEINLKNYVVERSTDGANFTIIGAITAANSIRYQYSDHIASFSGQRLYYRLRLADKDGKYKFTGVVTIKVPENTFFVVSPNPAKSVLKIKFSKPVNTAVLAINDMAGRRQMQLQLSVVTGSATVAVDKLVPGNYLLSIFYKDHLQVAKIQITH